MDRNPKDSQKSDTVRLKKKMIGLEMVLNLIEIVWWNSQKAVHQQTPANLDKLKQHCKDEWHKIPP